MPIEISEAPTVVRAGPRFAGPTISVRLTDTPSVAWLKVLAEQELPGKAHRAVEDRVEFYLDRDARDVVAAVRRIDEAIRATNGSYEEQQAEMQRTAAQTDERQAAQTEKMNRQLQGWWEARGG